MRLVLLVYCFLLKQSSSSRSWGDGHERDTSMVKLVIPSGVSYLEETRRLVVSCNLTKHESSLLDTVRTRYKFTLKDDVVAAYPMIIVVQVNACFCQSVAWQTPGRTHDFGSLCFDYADDVPKLAREECARMSGRLGTQESLNGCAGTLQKSMEEQLGGGTFYPCSPECPAARSRRRSRAFDDGLKAALMGTEAALKADRPEAAAAFAVVNATLSGLLPTRTKEAAPATRLGRCARVEEGSTCVVEDLYLFNGRFFALHDDGDQELVLPALSLSTRGSSNFEPAAMTRSAYREMVDVIGLEARSCSDEPILLLERDFEDPLHFGHVLTSYAMAAHWALSLLLVEEARLVLVDPGPASDADRWLATVFDVPPIYAYETETKLCPRGMICRVPFVVVGLRDLEWTSWRSRLELFGPVHRSFARRGRRLLGLPSSEDGPRRHRAVFVQRLHSRVVPGAERIAEAIGAKFVVLDFATMRDQLELMNDARVLIAVDGGALDLALLARPATGFLVLRRSPDSPSPDGCKECPDPCCDWHHDLFQAANETWLHAESMPHPTIDESYVAELNATLNRIEIGLRALPEHYQHQHAEPEL